MAGGRACTSAFTLLLVKKACDKGKEDTRIPTALLHAAASRQLCLLRMHFSNLLLTVTEPAGEQQQLVLHRIHKIPGRVSSLNKLKMGGGYRGTGLGPRRL